MIVTNRLPVMVDGIFTYSVHGVKFKFKLVDLSKSLNVELRRKIRRYGVNRVNTSKTT